jgi:SAM-dependent methyltransferase
MMVRYFASALALKAFSSGALAQNIYRKIGNMKNSVINKKKLPEKYFFRTDKFLDLIREHGLANDGISVLEVGTGWSHWEALVLRNEIACQSTLYDVWDNRSFARLKAYIGFLCDPAIRTRLGLRSDGAISLMQRCLTAGSIEELYKMLDFRYLVDPSGLLAGLVDNTFDLVISSDVGEHFHRSDVPEIMARTRAVLKPGGCCYMQIVLTDHLGIYDKSVHPKQFLAFSKRFHARWLENGVQYINLLQLPEWRDVFATTGFEIVEERVTSRCDIDAIGVHADWAGFSRDDLSVTVVQFLLRKNC